MAGFRSIGTDSCQFLRAASAFGAFAPAKEQNVPVAYPL
jgi:hypothetical protein